MRARTHPDAVRQLFDWEDPNRYEWAIRGSTLDGGVLHAIGPVIGQAVIFVLSYVWTAVAVSVLLFIYSGVVTWIGIERLGGLSRLVIAFKFGSGILITVILLTMTARFFWLRWRGTPKQRIQAESNLHELLTTAIGVNAFVVSTLTASGFGGSVDPFGEWLRFFAQHALRAVSYDLSEVFLRFSDIEPHTWDARLETVVFRFLIALGLVDFLWAVYKRRFSHETFHGTVKECLWKCQNLLDRDTLELSREGTIVDIKPPERTVTLTDFIEALEERDR